MGDEVSRGIGGWVISVTTLGRGEREPHVAVFHAAFPKARDAIDAVARACGAPSSAIAIETHLSHTTLALMRLKQGELRMRKSLRRPRDISQLAKRIVDIATGGDSERELSQSKCPDAGNSGRRKVGASKKRRHVESMDKKAVDANEARPRGTGRPSPIASNNRESPHDV
jgi:hypothetical protein